MKKSRGAIFDGFRIGFQRFTKRYVRVAKEKNTPPPPKKSIS
jgi:hypothetical protein